MDSDYLEKINKLLEIEINSNQNWSFKKRWEMD